MRVAVLEDDIAQLELLSHWLKLAGHSAHGYQLGGVLLRELVRESFDVLVLDWNLPDISGVEVLGRVRQQSTVPVVFCTARGDEVDVVTALRAGADDYLVKPARRMELIARLGVVKRRTHRVESQAFEVGAFSVDCQARTIRQHGVPLELTTKDFDLSVLFLQNVGRLLSRQVMRDAVWGSQFNMLSRTIDTHVSRVRTALGLTPEHGWRLAAVYGHGYRLEQCKTELVASA